MRRRCAALAVFLSAGLPCAAGAGQEEDALLALKALGQIKVTSVSKKEENAFETSSAIFVLNQDDIQRSGATSIPEVLRLVPGIHVARTDANKWVVSSRGFSDQFANKLLVLIDGRTVYTPLFSGVYWDVQGMMLEDIDRVEVIRGPGATLWGANAVNGVINIITKKARETQGTYLSAGAGNEEKGFAEGRYGGKFSEYGAYRVYAQQNLRDDSSTRTGQDADDGWRFSKGGFRMDRDDPGKGDFLTLQSDVYYGRKDWQFFTPVLTSPFISTGRYTEDLTGGNVLGRWRHRTDSGAEGTLQTYVDTTYRDNFSFYQTVTTLDVDYQYAFKQGERHDIVWGTGWRSIFYDFDSTYLISFPSDTASEQVWNAFVQDKYTVLPDSLFATVGSKFEYNDHTAFEVQPTARLTWLPDRRQTLWTAVSRAVRTPSIAEDEISLVVGSLGSAPGFARWRGNPSLDSEKMIAYEVGYRVLPTKTWDIDVTGYYNDYSQIRSYQNGAIIPATDPGLPPHFVFPITFQNYGSGEIYGSEIFSSWQATRDWTLSAGYNLVFVNIHLEPGARDTLLERDEGKTPHNQLTLRSQLDLPEHVQWDNTLYYVDSIRGVDAYLRFDTRIGWRPTYGVELQLVGQNLFDPRHPEFPAGLYGQATQVDRSFYGQVKLRF